MLRAYILYASALLLVGLVGAVIVGRWDVVVLCLPGLPLAWLSWRLAQRDATIGRNRRN